LPVKARNYTWIRLWGTAHCVPRLHFQLGSLQWTELGPQNTPLPGAARVLSTVISFQGNGTLQNHLMPRMSKRNNHIEEAIALLIRNQASFVQNQASFLSQMVEMNRVNAERFERIEKRLDRIESILVHLAQILEGLPEAIRHLPEAIRQKIGFKPSTL
jgi:hypothetical protein